MRIILKCLFRALVLAVMRDWHKKIYIAGVFPTLKLSASSSDSALPNEPDARSARAAKRFRVSLVQDLLHDEGSGKEDKELAPAPANKDASVQVTLRLQYPCLIGPWNTL